jgi:hypothetical protein
MDTEVYQAMDDENRAAVISSIYSYAADAAQSKIAQGREKDYESKYAKLEGVTDIAGYFALRQAVSALTDSETASTAAVDAALDWLDTQSADQQTLIKSAISGLDDLAACRKAGVSYETYRAASAYSAELNSKGVKGTEKTTAFTSWLDGQDLTYLQKMELRASFTSTATARYEDMVEAGISEETAAQVFTAVDSLTPESGAASVSALQKYEAVTSQTGLSQQDTLTILSCYATETAYTYYKAAYDAGIDLNDWTRVLRYINDNQNGNVSMTGLIKACGRSGLTESQCQAMYAAYAQQKGWTTAYSKALASVDWN